MNKPHYSEKEEFEGIDDDEDVDIGDFDDDDNLAEWEVVDVD